MPQNGRPTLRKKLRDGRSFLKNQQRGGLIGYISDFYHIQLYMDNERDICGNTDTCSDGGNFFLLMQEEKNKINTGNCPVSSDILSANRSWINGVWTNAGRKKIYSDSILVVSCHSQREF